MKQKKASYPSLQDKHVFITGGATGIGAALVKACVTQNMKVTFVDLENDAAEKLIDSLNMAMYKPQFFYLDLRNISDLEASIQNSTKKYGDIEVLINNAARDTRLAIEEIDVEKWDDMQAINIRHVFFASKAVAKGMKKIGSGSIINFTSSSVIRKSPQLTAYSSAKAGIAGMTRMLARDLGKYNIRVNSVLPGWIMTERQQTLWLTPETEKRLIEDQCLKEKIYPEDVADMVLFLASVDSCKVTAQNFIIDAGWV